MTFLLFFSHKSYTSFLPHFFIYFFINFYVKLYMIFPKGTVGVFIAKMKEWEASFGVPWYTSASRPFKGMTSIGVPWYTNASSILTRFVSTSSAFFFVCVSFFDFWTDFHAAIWRHFPSSVFFKFYMHGEL